MTGTDDWFSLPEGADSSWGFSPDESAALRDMYRDTLEPLSGTGSMSIRLEDDDDSAPQPLSNE